MTLTAEQKKYLLKNDFWKGNYCFKYKLPWLTPESVIFIDNILNKNVINNCLEIGSGGSTLFFIERCNNIISIERDSKYCNNDNINHIDTNKKLEGFLKEKNKLFDLIILDSHLLDCKREDIFNLIINYFSLDNSIFIIDNYNSTDQFKNIKKINNENLKEKYFSNDFIIKDFNDPKWARDSKGTRVIYHKNLIL